jgi:hypothetical protein
VHYLVLSGAQRQSLGLRRSRFCETDWARSAARPKCEAFILSGNWGIAGVEKGG